MKKGKGEVPDPWNHGSEADWKQRDYFLSR